MGGMRYINRDQLQEENLPDGYQTPRIPPNRYQPQFDAPVPRDYAPPVAMVAPSRVDPRNPYSLGTSLGDPSPMMYVLGALKEASAGSWLAQPLGQLEKGIGTGMARKSANIMRSVYQTGEIPPGLEGKELQDAFLARSMRNQAYGKQLAVEARGKGKSADPQSQLNAAMGVLDTYYSHGRSDLAAEYIAAVPDPELRARLAAVHARYQPGDTITPENVAAGNMNLGINANNRADRDRDVGYGQAYTQGIIADLENQQKQLTDELHTGNPSLKRVAQIRAMQSSLSKAMLRAVREQADRAKVRRPASMLPQGPPQTDNVTEMPGVPPVRPDNPLQGPPSIRQGPIGPELYYPGSESVGPSLGESLSNVYQEAPSVGQILQWTLGQRGKGHVLGRPSQPNPSGFPNYGNQLRR